MFSFHYYVTCYTLSISFRKESEVKNLLQHANLEEKDLLPETQVLYFTPGFHPEEDNIVLLELDATLLGSLQEGQR